MKLDLLDWNACFVHSEKQSWHRPHSSPVTNKSNSNLEKIEVFHYWYEK